MLKNLQRQIDLPVHSFQSECMLPYLLSGRGKMRERALKVVMVLVGLLFVAGVYPIVNSL